MKTSLIKIAGLLALAVGFGSVAKAIPITGQIHIDAFASTASVNFSTHTITFNGTIPNSNGIVSHTSGDYNGLLGAAANYNNFQYQPFTSQTLWTITLTPTTYFVLNAITLIDETGTVGVSLWGNGTAYMAGHDATYGEWTFSASKNAPDAVFNWSSSTTVPDGGTTAMLVGLGLLGMSVVSRRRVRA
ncbi:MAG: hypothetical protein JWM35_2059 [Verrucomicrobia bacterium]|nr:hypothetical protein [Verrucomicrobiota bacterium]